MPPARRGYGYGSGSAVVDGTGVDPVQACQGSYAPVQAIGMVRANKCSARARIVFGKPQPEAQRAA